MKTNWALQPPSKKTDWPRFRGKFIGGSQKTCRGVGTYKLKDLLGLTYLANNIIWPTYISDQFNPLKIQIGHDSVVSSLVVLRKHIGASELIHQRTLLVPPLYANILLIVIFIPFSGKSQFHIKKGTENCTRRRCCHQKLCHIYFDWQHLWWIHRLYKYQTNKVELC